MAYVRGRLPGHKLAWLLLVGVVVGLMACVGADPGEIIEWNLQPEDIRRDYAEATSEAARTESLRGDGPDTVCCCAGIVYPTMQCYDAPGQCSFQPTCTGVAADRRPPAPSPPPATVESPARRVPLAASLFERAFYINMDDAPAKQAEMEALGKHEGLQLERWPGVRLNGLEDVNSDAWKAMAKNRTMPTHDLPLRTAVPTWWPPTWKHFRDVRVYGCFLAHRGLMEKLAHDYPLPATNASVELNAQAANKTEDPWFLVLEDDVQFVDGWQEKLRAVAASLPADWDVLRIGYWGLARDQDAVPDKHVFKACPPSFTWSDYGFHYMGTHAVVLRRSRLHRVIDYLDSRPTIDDLDVLYTAPSCDASPRLLNSYVLDTRLVLAPHNSYFYNRIEQARALLH